MVKMQAQNPNANPLIGPHEGRELELMLKGEKPAAMFYEVLGHDEGLGLVPDADFQPYVDSGQILKREKIYSDGKYSTRYVFFALPRFKKNIDTLIEIQDQVYDPKRDKSIPWSNERERKIGELLGYSENAIITFLKHLEKFKN